MSFDFTINIGTLMELATIIVGGFWFMVTMNTKLSILIVERKSEHAANITKFDDIEKQLEKLVDVTIRLATQEERINAINNKLETLMGLQIAKTNGSKVVRPR
jgi:L-lysine 2,3-aminomutase